MIRLVILALVTFSLSAYATPIMPRAGAPTSEPLPPTCHFSNAVPQWNSSIMTNVTSGYQPKSKFAGPHTIYSGYYSLLTPASELWTQCTQRCYAYGHGGDDRSDCKSAILAHNVPVPEGYYGLLGGELRTACFLFSKYIMPDDWEKAREGQWLEMRTGNLYCEI